MAKTAPSARKPTAPSGRSRDRARMLEVVERFLALAERRKLTVRVPREEGMMQRVEGMHFHFKPEVFLQTSGTTHFRFPKEAFDLRENELAVIPAGVPHGESVSGGAHAFQNLVAGFYSHTMSMHFAREVAPGKPDIEVIEFFDTPDLDTYLTLTNAVVAAYHNQPPARDHVLRGLVTALLGLFKDMIATGMGELNADIGKVFQAKWLVREQFANPKLSVASIAEKLQCSPDYLSHLFHTETGEKLVHYIQRVRIDGAAVALRNPSLYISEIAYSSGFSDPAYFARVFKKHRGETPQEFRARIDRERQQQEANPKTIYHDHVDYSPGKPAADADDPAAARSKRVSRKPRRTTD
ncbi:MAG: AraC family transcriptional regulator [Verrucomicrobia bacterium]|nr:MAG: AraC family transcriptional regulator [Verrucomicrobiota bacterium]